MNVIVQESDVLLATETTEIESENHTSFSGATGPYFWIEFTEVFEVLRNPRTPTEQAFRVSIRSGIRYPAVRSSIYLQKHDEIFPWLLVYVPTYADTTIKRWLGCHEEIFKDKGVIFHESGA